MKIESHLQPNCSESSWRVTGPKKELEALKKKFLDRCDCDEHTEWIKETLLLQTRDQETAASILEEYDCPGHNLKFYEDIANARDCTCGGKHCPDEKWSDISNLDKLVRGLVKPVKEKK
jgi:hypothetical protein